MTSRSTARPLSSAPAIEMPSSMSCGVTTTSQSRLTPRATASTGSKLRARSSQATIEPVACASATVRRASVVLPLDPSPRSPTLVARGKPPAPRTASSPAKPVETTPSAGSSCGIGRSSTSSSGRGTVARAPTTSPTSPTAASSREPAHDPVIAASDARRGAAAPQRDWRVARAAVTSADRVAMGRSLSNVCSIPSRGGVGQSGFSGAGTNSTRHLPDRTRSVRHRNTVSISFAHGNRSARNPA